MRGTSPKTINLSMLEILLKIWHSHVTKRTEFRPSQRLLRTGKNFIAAGSTRIRFQTLEMDLQIGYNIMMYNMKFLFDL